jgi:ribosomal protein S18 acetylase RimI-like enzyme
MIIDGFRHADVNAFLALAAEENWICGQWEFDFLLRCFPQGCLAMRMDDTPVGFITAIKYGTSGWIGNLVVRRDLRGKGIGNTLMKKALASLADAGARTIWLTASEAGRSIYARLGFSLIDMVKRWYGTGSGGDDGATGDYSMTAMLAMDQGGWGDARETILTETLKRGTLTVRDGGFLISQPASAGIQLGPWGAVGPETAGALLDIARARAVKGTRLFLDAPARNDDAASLLQSRGFAVRGSALLMFLGEKPAYEPGRIYALASMGSMG